MKVEVTLIDLWPDFGGWSANGARVTREVIDIPDGSSDLSASRRILASVGAQGFKRDGWCDSDFGAWRSGCLGVYADVVG